SPPEREEADDEADVRRVEDVLAAPLDDVLREERDRGRADIDPPAAQAPPVSVGRSGDAEDEGDAVSGEQRARRPENDALREQRNRYFEDRRRADREQDLGDRELEVEAELSDHLK